MAKTKLILADHHVLDRQALRCLLEKETDIEILGESGDGEQLLEKIKSKKPDVVLLDISMPKLNGADAIHRIKEISSRIEIVVLTDSRKKTTIHEALNAGVSGYLLKTGTITDLLSAIRAAKEKKYFLSPEINTDIIDTYLGRGGAASKTGRYEQLTKSEKRVFRLIAEGNTTNEIAEELAISPKTVAKHRMNLMEKLETKNTATLVRYAVAIGVVSVDGQPE